MPVVESQINTDVLTNMIGINGEPSVGKTTLATSLVESKNILYFDAENGSKYISGVQKFTPTGNAEDNPKNWKDFLLAANEVVKDKRTTIVIDNMANLCEWCATYICEENDKETLSDFGFGRGEKAALGEMKRVLDYFLQNNIGVIYICHKKPEYVKIKIKNSTEAEDAQRNSLNLPNWAKTYLIGQSDFLFFLYRDGFGELKIRTKGDDLTVCKDRPGFLPDVLPNNPVLLKKLLFSSKEKFLKNIEAVRRRMLDKFDKDADSYIKELGLDI